MLFVAIARFKPGFEPHRRELQSQFSEHMKSQAPHIRLGGPLVDGSGAHTGVFMVLESVDRATVDHFLRNSPYGQAGGYSGVDLEELTLEVGALR